MADEKKKLYKLLELADMTNSLALHKKLDILIERLKKIESLDNSLPKLNKIEAILSAPKVEKQFDYSPINEKFGIIDKRIDGVLDTIDKKIDGIHRSIANIPQPKFPEVKIPTPPDTSKHHKHTHDLITTMMSMLPTEYLKNENLDDIKADIEALKNRRPNASMYQAWTVESVTFTGTSNTYVLKQFPKANSLHVYLQGVYQDDQVNNDYSLSNKTITFALGPTELTNQTAIFKYAI